MCLDRADRKHPRALGYLGVGRFDGVKDVMPVQVEPRQDILYRCKCLIVEVGSVEEET